MFVTSRKIFLTWIVILLLLTSAQAAVYDVMGQGVLTARTISLGKATVASSGYIDALYVNPAGLATLKNPGVLGYSQSSFGGMNKNMMAYAYPTKLGIFTFGIVKDDITGIHVADNTGKIIDTISYFQSMFSVGYAIPLTRQLYLGGAFKYYNNDLDAGDYSAKGYDFDLGIIYKLRNDLDIGLAYQNVLGSMEMGGLEWSTGTREALAGVFKAGIAYYTNVYNRPVTLYAAVDKFVGADLLEAYHLGIEPEINQHLVLRLGLDNNHYTLQRRHNFQDIFIGLGIKYAGISIDYSYFVNAAVERSDRHLLSAGITFDNNLFQTEPLIEPKEEFTEIKPIVEIKEELVEVKPSDNTEAINKNTEEISTENVQMEKLPKEAALGSVTENIQTEKAESATENVQLEEAKEAESATNNVQVIEGQSNKEGEKN
ncbi:MAG: hypothetical protein KKA19_02235, partial [Candidatus Margulisbacteria bacterium]|nr:hypothetical protein [Candidatus Margulisiibacteriota bacterium]